MSMKEGKENNIHKIYNNKINNKTWHIHNNNKEKYPWIR